MLSQEGHLARNIDRHVTLSGGDASLLAELDAHPRRVPRGSELWQTQRPSDHLYTLCRGWACSYHRSANGSQQILDLFVPGDIMGLRDLTYHDHTSTAVMLTTGQVSAYPVERVSELMRCSRRLDWALQASAARQERLITQRLINVLSHDAVSRIAHLMLEVQHRLQRVDAASGDQFYLPLLQRQIGMLLGMSSVHVSRTLIELSRRGLLERSRRRIHLLDVEALARIADFTTFPYEAGLNPELLPEGAGPHGA